MKKFFIPLLVAFSLILVIGVSYMGTSGKLFQGYSKLEITQSDQFNHISDIDFEGPLTKNLCPSEKQENLYASWDDGNFKDPGVRTYSTFDDFYNYVKNELDESGSYIKDTKLDNNDDSKMCEYVLRLYEYDFVNEEGSFYMMTCDDIYTANLNRIQCRTYLNNATIYVYLSDPSVDTKSSLIINHEGQTFVENHYIENYEVERR